MSQKHVQTQAQRLFPRPSAKSVNYFVRISPYEKIGEILNVNLHILQAVNQQNPDYLADVMWSLVNHPDTKRIDGRISGFIQELYNQSESSNSMKALLKGVLNNIRDYNQAQNQLIRSLAGDPKSKRPTRTSPKKTIDFSDSEESQPQQRVTLSFDAQKFWDQLNKLHTLKGRDFNRSIRQLRQQHAHPSFRKEDVVKVDDTSMQLGQAINIYTENLTSAKEAAYKHQLVNFLQELNGDNKLNLKHLRPAPADKRKNAGAHQFTGTTKTEERPKTDYFSDSKNPHEICNDRPKIFVLIEQACTQNNPVMLTDAIRSFLDHNGDPFEQLEDAKSVNGQLGDIIRLQKQTEEIILAAKKAKRSITSRTNQTDNTPVQRRPAQNDNWMMFLVDHGGTYTLATIAATKGMLDQHIDKLMKETDQNPFGEDRQQRTPAGIILEKMTRTLDEKAHLKQIELIERMRTHPKFDAAVKHYVDFNGRALDLRAHIADVLECCVFSMSDAVKARLTAIQNADEEQNSGGNQNNSGNKKQKSGKPKPDGTDKKTTTSFHAKMAAQQERESLGLSPKAIGTISDRLR